MTLSYLYKKPKTKQNKKQVCSGNFDFTQKTNIKDIKNVDHFAITFCLLQDKMYNFLKKFLDAKLQKGITFKLKKR